MINITACEANQKVRVNSENTEASVVIVPS